MMKRVVKAVLFDRWQQVLVALGIVAFILGALLGK